MKDMGEISYVIGIKIHRERSKYILSLSQKTYINKILEWIRMNNYLASIASIVARDKFNLDQYPKDNLKSELLWFSKIKILLYFLEKCKVTISTFKAKFLF